MDELQKENHESDTEVEKAYAMSIAPFVQIPHQVAKKMLDISQIKTGEVLYDLGCGDGLMIILAAKEFGAKATGIELKRI